MGKGHVYQQQYYGGGGDGMWMESQAQQSYAFHEEYNAPGQYSHHHMQTKPFAMESHGHGYDHGHGMLTKPGSGYHAYGGSAVGGGKMSIGGGKFNHLHHSGYNNSSYAEESEEFESYSEEQHYGGGATNTMYMDHARGGYYGNNPYEARINRNTGYMGYNNKPTHGAHKYVLTAKGV